MAENKDPLLDMAASAVFELAKVEMARQGVNPTYRMQILADKSEDLARVVTELAHGIRGLFKAPAEDDIEQARRLVGRC